MELPAWQPGTVGLSVRDAGVLARSPLYPKWRVEVEKVFAQVDDAVEKSGALAASSAIPALPAAGGSSAGRTTAVAGTGETRALG